MHKDPFSILPTIIETGVKTTKIILLALQFFYINFNTVYEHFIYGLENSFSAIVNQLALHIQGLSSNTDTWNRYEPDELTDLN